MVFYGVDQSKMPPNVNVKQKLTGFLDFVSSPVCHVPVSRSKYHVILIDPDNPFMWQIMWQIIPKVMWQVPKNDRLTDTDGQINPLIVRASAAKNNFSKMMIYNFIFDMFEV